MIVTVCVTLSITLPIVLLGTSDNDIIHDRFDENDMVINDRVIDTEETERPYVYTEEERIAFYLGDIDESELDENKPLSYEEHLVPSHYTLSFLEGLNIDCKYVKGYMKALQKARIHEENIFGAMRGDGVYTDLPNLIMKSKCIEHKYKSTIIRLNMGCHWHAVWPALKDPISFDDKMDELIWRGVTTGWRRKDFPRKKLVNTWYKDMRVNVGFTHNHLPEKIDGICPEAIKGKISREEISKRRYIVVAEGNDVGTSCKWVLASNSVPFMSKPTHSTWAMESTLVPWTHYVPLSDDYSDLYSKLEWARLHPSMCRKIARNGRYYIEQFLDEDRENFIEKRVLEEYFNRTGMKQSCR